MLLFVTLLPLIFHMAAAANQTDYLSLVMTSPLSGYVTVGKNLEEEDPEYLHKDVFVPRQHWVMVSFRELAPNLTDVVLFRYSQSLPPPQKTKLWSRSRDDVSDFAHLLTATQLSLRVSTSSCMHTACFHLFFSFFSHTERPRQLPGGLWNCSVEHHGRFLHHLACNLKAECEAGQDETGDCPYSSAQCQGRLALCDHCYTIVRSLRDFSSNKRDLGERANDYCNSVQSTLSLPTCIYNWHGAMRNKTRIHTRRLEYLWAGMYTDVRWLPSMYIHSISQEDRTVLHHSVSYHSYHHLEGRSCLVTTSKHSLFSMSCRYDPKLPHLRLYGAVCKVTQTGTEDTAKHSAGISATRLEPTPLTAHEGMTTCPGGHVTHTFLLCDSDCFKICGGEARFPCRFGEGVRPSPSVESPDLALSSVPSFQCGDEASTSLSFTLLCDFLPDCPDSSDELFCLQPACSRQFRCDDGQCLSFDAVCDYMFQCRDKSDEKDCNRFRHRSISSYQHTAHPTIVHFDNAKTFLATPMSVNESCPSSHYRCTGEFNDCLPVYTRCNGMYDCLDHSDEDRCVDHACPGYFQCRLSKICVHTDQICDGWPHCPMSDDELACDTTCPSSCLCQGYTFQCPQPFLPSLFPQLRFLDATSSGMTVSDVGNNSLLVGAMFVRCSLTLLPTVELANLRLLDVSENQLQYVNLTSVLALGNLRTLSLSRNPLVSLHTGLSCADQRSALTSLDLSHTALTVMDTAPLLCFPHIQRISLTSTSVHTISPAGFTFTPQLTELYLDGSPVKVFPPDIFRHLSHLRFLSTQNYKLCCGEMLPYNFNRSACLAPKDEISSCEDLLRSWVYRGFLWLVAFLSLTGNAFCCFARLFWKSMASSSGFSVFVTNLTMADFLMGVYMALIGLADQQFRGRYLHNDNAWKASTTCKVAGFLSLMSSEVSALIIGFITLDRFIVLRFLFSTLKFTRTSAALASALTWALGCLLALLPLLPVTSRWEFYSQTGICIPLPVTRKDFAGRTYSFSVLIVLNFLLFLCVSAGQAFIYWSIKGNSMKIDSTKESQDKAIARRLITIAVTDFLCWFPIGLCGLLALAGTPIPGEVNVALAIFVLPLNSAINPFLYTFNTLAEKRRKRKESKLLKWLHSHPELLSA